MLQWAKLLQLWAGWGFDEVGGSEGKGGCGRCKCNVDGEPRQSRRYWRHAVSDSMEM